MCTKFLPLVSGGLSRQVLLRHYNYVRSVMLGGCWGKFWLLMSKVWTKFALPNIQSSCSGLQRKPLVDDIKHLKKVCRVLGPGKCPLAVHDKIRHTCSKKVNNYIHWNVCKREATARESHLPVAVAKSRMLHKQIRMLHMQIWLSNVPSRIQLTKMELLKKHFIQTKV